MKNLKSQENDDTPNIKSSKDLFKKSMLKGSKIKESKVLESVDPLQD